MSIEIVKDYFRGMGMEDKVLEFDVSSATVRLAAVALGTEEARIAKTMSFLVDEQPIVIVSAGDAKVKNNKYKAFFHKKAKMIPWDHVESVIGHEPGGVCPFVMNEGVKVYLDVSLQRFDIVHAAAGRPDATVSLTISELEKTSGMIEWVDLCDGWREEE